MLQRTKLKKINKDKNLRIEFSRFILQGKTFKEAVNTLIPEKEKTSKEFYASLEWKKVRYDVLKESNGRCCLCGRSAKDGVVLQVDHIVPLSKDWSKRLDKSNLQVLCEDCNLGKSNRDSINWKERS